MEVLIWILLIVGLIGAVLPGLPGPIFSALALSIAQYTHPTATSVWGWIALGLIIFVVDYFLPGYMTKKGGASSRASKGALIGMLVGIVTGPGMLLSGAIGAFIGEYSVTNDGAKSLRAAFFAMLGVVSGVVFKVIYAAGMIALYVISLL